MYYSFIEKMRGSFLLLMIVLVSLEFCLVSNVVVDALPHVVYYLELPFYDLMTTRLEKYNETSDWMWKVHPSDIPYLNYSSSVVYVEIYVLNPEEAVVYSKDLHEPERIQTVFYVYQTADNEAEKLSHVPHTYFYKSKFTPSISMEVEKDFLPEIAKFSFVYCIRVIPEPKLLVTIDEARTYNDIMHAQTLHDADLDPMDIAIIDTGYDVNEGHLFKEAADNIAYTWDFTDNDADVTDGTNTHGTTCADLLARALGDAGEDDSMYDTPSVYHILKIGEDPDVHKGPAREAIEWCIENDMEVVSMSWGWEPVVWFLGIPFPEYNCNNWWCNLFRLGVESGVTWVAGAGNMNANWGVAYPAESHFVIAVGGYQYVNETTREAERWFWPSIDAGSNYGLTYYASPPFPPPDVYCGECYIGSGFLFYEFKPNVYDAAVISEILDPGTSWAAALAAASIALGIYSQPSEPTDLNWIPGFQMVHDTIALCNEWTVIPDECSQQGEVIDTNTLWHREVIQDKSLTTLAKDQYDNALITGDVYIDGQLIGYTGSTFELDVGNHTVQVNDFWENNITGYRYGFTRWEDDSTYNPRNIQVIEDKTITAYFFKKYCPGDVDGSGVVDDADIDILNAAWLSVRGNPDWDSRADLNCDAHIDILDLNIVGQNYGNIYYYYLTVLAQDQYGISLTTGDVYIDGQWVGTTNSTFPILGGNHTVFVNDFWDRVNEGYRYNFTNWEDGSTSPTRTITVIEDTTITAYFYKKWCPGDVNGDGVVDIYDVVIVGNAYGSQRGLGDPWPPGNDWDSQADPKPQYGLVDIFDLTSVSTHYGKNYLDP